MRGGSRGRPAGTRGDFASRLLASRGRMAATPPREGMADVRIEEGGCGVVGFASSIPVRGRNIFEPSIQMHNRGNGKGGGIAAAGAVPEQLGVSSEVLRDDYILQIALLDSKAEREVERRYVAPNFRIDHKARIAPVADYRDLGLPVKPPDIVRYFVRGREARLRAFARRNSLSGAPERAVEDEFVYQNSFRLNGEFYASLGEKRAFVMSHARDLMIFKIVGYAENVVQYYGLEDMRAQVWIAHQRYPTKGRMWHPGGSHPFIGMNEALVHNGDFANYLSIADYLRQHNIVPQFLTDTEVSVLLFDLWHRVYGYPTEYVIEALAPTTELDFDRLPAAKRKVYRAIQSMHMHGSPDGPWFFIIARSEPDENRIRLLGITDTSMLRPQVFALQEGDVSVGLVASEKQAIDATLKSLREEDARFRPVADRYWNARGGSSTDGGAFVFTVDRSRSSHRVLCADKFGRPVGAPGGEWEFDPASAAPPAGSDGLLGSMGRLGEGVSPDDLYRETVRLLPAWRLDNVRWLVRLLEETARRGDSAAAGVVEFLALLNDRRYDCGVMRRSVVLQMVREAIDSVLASVPPISREDGGAMKRIAWDTRNGLRRPNSGETTLVVDAEGFPPEGEECDARLLVRAGRAGWRRFLVHGLKGQRFAGCGFGPASGGIRIDLFGSSGDYLASGIDGLEMIVHDSAQDQLGQIMKDGKLVIYGDVGQTFMYGAKGGEVYVMGNAAGRPLINAVGRPRVIINGTCLDFLAESFMAGDPHRGGGFVVVNGVEFDDAGRVREQATPYPGSNLFSLASGGAIFVRDPRRQLVPGQLNGGEFVDMTENDWRLILPYLERNENLFGISVKRDLLTVDGEERAPERVYRKVQPVKLAVLAREEVPE